MTTANCPGNEELDFRLIFGEDGQQQPLGPADLEPDDNTSFYILNVGQPQSMVTNHQSIGLPRHGMQSHSQIISTSPRLHSHKPGSVPPGYGAHDSKYGTSPLLPSAPVEAPKAFECPSIQITSISPSCQQEMDATEEDLRANVPDGDYHGDRPLSRDHLYLPLDHSYRDSSLSPSPCSSLSSRSWFSDASSCESFSHVYDDVDSELNEAAARFTLGSPLTSPGCVSPQTSGGLLEEQPHWQHHHPAFVHHSHSISLSPRQSPCHSPRTSVTDENWLSPRPPSRPSSRPTSPCGKRRHSSADICYPGSLSPHHSPTPTPGPSPRGSVTEDTWVGSPSVGMSPFQCCPSEADIPSKTRKTSQDRTSMHTGKGELGLDDQGNMSPNLDSPSDEGLHSLKKDGPGEQFLSVPSHFSWNKPKPGHTPIFRTSSLPPLDWPLPSQFGQYDLKIEVQPKAHHRAHYETEGSRGAVKAASGGHPIVKLIGYSEKPINLQMFIGTADDRYLRPHAFYQVHRITGKTVATASQEIVVSSTKVLEIPLLPENNMSASIDCAGILKLRNSDIELRKGETDIGRKNTRVRVVFRVHIPQSNGKVLSLQATSIPVECSQRSAQELPQVEKSSLTSCLVSGGEEMVITGSNFFPESKVIFLEKGPDGRPQWEVEAKIMREKTQGSCIVVEVPPYHSKSVGSAVQVQFYVCNGKRKRSQSQRFTYLSVMVKQEHREELDLSAVPPMAMPLAHAASLVRTQLPSPEQCHPSDNLLSSSPHGLATGSGPGLLPLQAPCPSLGSPSFQHLPHLHSRSLHHPPADCHMTFHQGSAPSPLPAPPRPSYQPMQHSHSHSHSLPFNSQSSLPPQGYDRMPFQQSPSAASHPMSMGMVYPTSPCSSPSAPSSSTTNPIAGSPQSQQPLLSPSSPHLHTIGGYHCSPNPTQVPSPGGHPLVGQHSSQLQRAMSYHPVGQRSASCPTPPSAPSPRMIPSPHSGPSSPQLHSLPYQSPTSSSPTSGGSPLGPMQQQNSGQRSPQATSPVMVSLSPVAAGPLGHPLSPQGPFPSDGERLNIKEEPEEREPTFRSIGLQDITLDDVNEIIGRDMSQSPSTHGPPTAHSQS
ncbi:nuclear factor of activated T-cells, cytoplasmic 3 isoform X1 [Etheostoma spectabile]|uniref:nuclear factor of activated T-cells, cytoplasmic 3 isoform X1 n=2 Tax=Etheostoma spectabile TaxID=54343 RepID=UPI0013AFD229|nr:nuclear factor of activated T-cells, cytoplasmic 3 isoform X1 [Etheostoma spectabile]XP_032392432.1 nuclear factor of activated T-cells, cytoplasmic 3-like isoform X1 [Etheostoma spectabile]